MDIKFRNNKIILIGDVHSLDRLYAIIKHKPNLENFDCLQIGDAGIGFTKKEYDETRLRKINNECYKRKINLFIIRGNHDRKWFWEQNYCFSNLFLVTDYSSARFPNGKTGLLVGGGISIDRPARREDLDYWSDEITIYQKTNEKHDFLFAHDCPNYFNHSTESLWSSPYQDFLRDDAFLFEDALNQRNVIGRIVNDIDCKFCFSGHFHNSWEQEKNEIKYRCLNIEELLEFDANE